MCKKQIWFLVLGQFIHINFTKHPDIIRILVQSLKFLNFRRSSDDLVIHQQSLYMSENSFFRYSKNSRTIIGGLYVTIELIGLPGSGKSHISRLVAGRLRQAGLPAEELTRSIGHSPELKRIASKSGYALIFLLLHPLLAARTLSAVVRTRQSSLRNLLTSLFNMFFIRGLLLSRERRQGILVLDQGLIQALASIHYGSVRRLPESFLAALPAPDLVVRVAASPRTLVERLAVRASGGGSRVETDPAAELPRFAAALESLVDVPPLAGANIIEIGNDGDGEALSRELDLLLLRVVQEYTSPN